MDMFVTRLGNFHCSVIGILDPSFRFDASEPTRRVRTRTAHQGTTPSSYHVHAGARWLVLGDATAPTSFHVHALPLSRNHDTFQVNGHVSRNKLDFPARRRSPEVRA